MHSVFTKLSVVILIAVVFINLMVFGLFRAQRQSSIAAFQNIQAQYLEYLIEDLGTSPNQALAKQKTNKALICIRYTGKDGSWSTDPEVVPRDDLRWHQWTDYPHIRSGVWRSRYVIEVQHANGIYDFVFGRDFDQETQPHRLLVLLLLVLTTLIAIVYLSIRWILKPIKWLKQGVQEISRGNLTHRVPAKRADELKDLAEGFNAMTERIREMLHSKERLLLDVSHELRSPLTRMRVAVEFLPDSHAKISIQTDIQEMEQMIAGVLETAKLHHRQTQLTPQKSNLSDIIYELLPVYQNQKPGLVFEPPKDPVVCDVDPDKIKVVLQNVLNNAMKYSGAAGHPVQISIIPRKSHVQIQVKDHGIGIPQEEISYILEPFYRVDKSRSKNTGGYGLGLSICKTIMDAHDGKIEIESALGKGTTVTLILPR